MSFFTENILQAIRHNESEPKLIRNFISESSVNELLEYRKYLSKKMVDREESTKLPFDFNDNSFLKSIKIKIEEIVGEFEVKDFEPHFITTRFPLRLHADTGKDPNDIIFKNIVLPLEVNHKSDDPNNKTSNTIIFKNKWYKAGALFTTKTSNDYDFIIKDKYGNFIDIYNIHDFKKNIDQTKNEIILHYNNADFFVDDTFRNYITSLSKTKRYNVRTDEHIKENLPFNKKIYEDYMTHQPYEDCAGLEFDVALPWQKGSLMFWDRVRIHSSDNFLKNNVLNKTCIALFTSRP
jgi:hypothetical protein